MPNLYRFQAPLLLLEAVSAAQEGDAHRIAPFANDSLTDDRQDFLALFSIDADELAVTGQLQTSWDGEHWLTIAEVLSSEMEGDAVAVELPAVGPYVRVLTSLEDATTATYSAQVRLVSNGHFRLTSA